MEKVSRIRGYLLGAAVCLLFWPTYITLAAPPLAQNITPPDFSWAADLPPILFLVLCACVIIALLVYLMIRVFPKQETKVADPKDPNKLTTVPELTIVSFNMMTQAFNNTNHLIEVVVEAIGGFKDELIQGRGNQMTAITDVHDSLNDKLIGMQGALQTRNEQMERVSGGILHLQNGQEKMQQDLEALLGETRRLTQSIVNILDRLEAVDTVVKKVDITIGDVSQSTITIKDEIRELKQMFHSVDDRLNRIAAAANNLNVPIPLPPMNPESTADPLAKPDLPTEKKDENVPPVPNVPAATG